MKDIIYKDYSVADKDFTTKKYVDSAVAKNKREVDILNEKLSGEATSLDILDLEGRLSFVGRKLAGRKKIGHNDCQ
nr:unnamed protein product [Callosobruchus chinensis]